MPFERGHDIINSPTPTSSLNEEAPESLLLLIFRRVSLRWCY